MTFAGTSANGQDAPNPAIPGPPGSSDAQRAARALTGGPTRQTHLRHGQPIFAVMHKNTAPMQRCGKVRSLAWGAPMRRRYTAISSRLMGHRRQFDQLNRRDFISLLGSTAAAWPLTSLAQQPDQLRLIVVLMPYAQSDGDAHSWLAAFRGALSKLGWTEGSNLRIEVRWSADNPDRMRALANELVDLRPNAIFGVTTPVVGALARETKTIPIVFAGVSDPIASGFAANLV